MVAYLLPTMYEDSLGLQYALPILMLLISVKLIPRLEPLIEMTVPPSMGPAAGLNYKTYSTQQYMCTVVLLCYSMIWW